MSAMAEEARDADMVVHAVDRVWDTFLADFQ